MDICRRILSKSKKSYHKRAQTFLPSFISAHFLYAERSVGTCQTPSLNCCDPDLLRVSTLPWLMTPRARKLSRLRSYFSWFRRESMGCTIFLISFFFFLPGPCSWSPSPSSARAEKTPRSSSKWKFLFFKKGFFSIFHEKSIIIEIITNHDEEPSHGYASGDEELLVHLLFLHSLFWCTFFGKSNVVRRKNHTCACVR